MSSSDNLILDQSHPKYLLVNVLALAYDHFMLQKLNKVY